VRVRVLTNSLAATDVKSVRLFVVSSGTVPHPACPAAIAQRGIAGTSGLVGR
jgi:hypothetical protein